MSFSNFILGDFDIRKSKVTARKTTDLAPLNPSDFNQSKRMRPTRF